MHKKSIKKLLLIFFSSIVISSCTISEESINNTKEEAPEVIERAVDDIDEIIDKIGGDIIHNIAISSNNGIDVNEENKKYAYEIMRCLEENDADGIFNMLCDQTKLEIHIPAKINEALKFFEGNIIDYGLVYNSGPNMQSSEKGKKTFIHCNPELRDISTDIGKVYRIKFSSTFVSKEETEIGVNGIVLYDENGDFISIS